MIREKLLVSASQLTSFKLGGEASVVYEPTEIDSLSELVKKLGKGNYYIIGNGSNVVFSDSGIKKPIIHLATEFASWYVVSEFPEKLNLKPATVLADTDLIKVIAFAGSPLMRMSSELTNLSYTGLEFAAGIPGSIGGAVSMNAGAHGNEISEIVEYVYLMDEQGTLSRIDKEKAAFSYRCSELSGVIVAAGLILKRADKEKILAKRRSCLEYRKETQPLTLPSAGSVFINIISSDSEVLHAATLLESIGLKGELKGGVQFSPIHSNWIVKISNQAKTSDLIELIDKAKSKIKEKYGLDLCTEIKFWS